MNFVNVRYSEPKPGNDQKILTMTDENKYVVMCVEGEGQWSL